MRVEKYGCERTGGEHTPHVDRDGDTVCSVCKLVIDLGPLGINGISRSGLQYGPPSCIARIERKLV